ncbi:MAG: ribulose-phosphate 3-epimerase [Bacteroidales bacterium]|nr:ribulose-phosphate 3-epimerase [Bacteroidales bacterium]
MQFQIAPSILSADFANLGKDIEMLNASADIIHLDIMDGTFVPNISFGFPVVEAVSKIASIPMDAHFMVVHPERWVKRCAEIGVKMMSFHQEAAKEDTAAILADIRANGMKAGLVINPDIPVENLFPYIGQADFFLIMSVFAGFGGQKFIPDSLKRIKTLKAELKRRGNDAPIEVDGGVSDDNVQLLKDAGASIFVAGSSVFKADDPAEAIARLRGEKRTY